MASQTWAYADTAKYAQGTSLAGYTVQATDGHIGKVDEATYDVDASYIVVDTGPWIFGKHVLLPAGLISLIDSDNQVIHVQRTKDQIKNAPPYDREAHRDDTIYRDTVGSYYETHTF